MKALLVLLSLFALLNLSAVKAQGYAPGYYSAHWKITKVTPMCPRDIPAGAVCFGLGSIVHVEATIGCVDELKTKEFTVWENNEIHAMSLVKVGPNADRVRCARAQVIQDIVLVPHPGEVTLVNDTLEF